MTPLYAHLYLDLDPALGRLMREKAPAVVRWIKRMNDEKSAIQEGEFLDDDQIPDTLFPILPYPNWMFHRSIDFCRSLNDTNEVDQLLHQVGIGGALKAGLKNRLARPNNLLQFAD